jgi:hypothetical protein
MSYSESYFSNRMSKNGNPCYIGSDSFISKQGNSVVKIVLDHFTEKSFQRNFLTERPFDRTPFDRMPFDRKFILPEGDDFIFVVRFADILKFWVFNITQKNTYHTLEWPFGQMTIFRKKLSVKWTLTSFSSKISDQMTIFHIFSVQLPFDKFCFDQMTFFGKINFRSNDLRLNGDSVKWNSVKRCAVKWPFGQKISVKWFYGKVIQNQIFPIEWVRMGTPAILGLNHSLANKATLWLMPTSYHISAK